MEITNMPNIYFHNKKWMDGNDCKISKNETFPAKIVETILKYPMALRSISSLFSCGHKGL